MGGIFNGRLAVNKDRVPHLLSIGQPITQDMTCEEVVDAYDFGFDIHREPINLADDNGTEFPTGKVLLIRPVTKDDPQPRLFGMASEDYHVLQARDFARVLDKAVTPHFKLATAGMLFKGETIFFNFDLGDDDVGGDPIRKYQLCTDTRDGTQSARILWSHVCVVCANTHELAIKDATVTLAIRHTQGMGFALESAARLMASVAEAEKRMMGLYRQMAATKIDDAGLNTILEAAYPVPEPPKIIKLIRSLEEFGEKVDPKDVERRVAAEAEWKGERAKAEAMREGAKLVYERYNDTRAPATRGTAWAGLNSITELVDWSPGRGDLAVSAVFGERAKVKTNAFRAAVSLLS